MTVFWGAVGSGIILWARRDFRKDLGAILHRHKSARNRNEAEVFEIQSKSFVEFEEVEDESACYAFEIGGDRIVFVTDQEFYPGPRFPCHDFAVVHILNERGDPVDMVIEKRGPRAQAVRMIPAATKLELEIPEHLEVITGTLTQVEDLLRLTGNRVANQ